MIKRLSGGLILLCLTSISLGVTSGEVSITDTDVLEQLKELRNFIDVNRDFTKGFKNLKPVLVEYRSSASKFNGIALGNLSFNTDALHMSIGVNTIQSDGKMLSLTIKVVYEWVDYIGYQVSSAKLIAWETLATGDGTFTGDVGVGGDLDVTGDASVGGDLSVTGNAVLPQINGESNPSVKPLYFHPILVESSNYRFTAIIINNVSTAYTKETFEQALTTYRLLIVSGGFVKDNNSYSATIVLTRTVNDVITHNLQGYGLTAGNIDIELGDEVTTFNDGVNKIN